jgi:predicted phosphodiesterase
MSNATFQYSGALAVISDAHGNIEALDRVLEDIQQRGITDIICLGDAIGYGPDPEGCVNRIRERGIPMILGNHEQGLQGQEYMDWFVPPVRKVLQKTRTMLSDATMQWIQTLPPTMERGDLLFVHGCPPDSVNKYLYTLDEDDLAEVFGSYPHRVAFAGHTHELYLFVWDDAKAWREDLDHHPVRLDPDRRYLVNAGSVGQPRDADKRAKYVILNQERDTLQAVFVEYDARKTVEAMRRVGMPEAYAKRLL